MANYKLKRSHLTNFVTLYLSIWKGHRENLSNAKDLASYSATACPSTLEP